MPKTTRTGRDTSEPDDTSEPESWRNAPVSVTARSPAGLIIALVSLLIGGVAMSGAAVAKRNDDIDKLETRMSAQNVTEKQALDARFAALLDADAAKAAAAAKMMDERFEAQKRLDDERQAQILSRIDRLERNIDAHGTRTR